MNKEEFIGKLEMVYVGDKRASKDIMLEYDRLNNIINELERKRTEALEYIEGFYYPDERQLTHEFDGWNLAKLYDILNKGDKNE